MKTTFLTVKTTRGFEIVPVRYVAKGALARLIASMLKPLGVKFLNRWTVIGQTIYYPDSVLDPLNPVYAEERERSLMLAEQFYRYGIILMALAYLVFPLPIFFSGRWFAERNFYLNSIRKNRLTIPQAVDILSKQHFYPWPESLMESWFTRELARLDG